MKKIMKKHKFTQLALSELLGITQTSVNNWVKPSANVRGVKKKYFDILSEKGFD
jgi:transcriptional regulator with XRE-family HTH domain